MYRRINECWQIPLLRGDLAGDIAQVANEDLNLFEFAAFISKKSEIFHVVS